MLFFRRRKKIWILVCVIFLSLATPSWAISDFMIEGEVVVTVEGVEGESASLPCDLLPTEPQDKVNLILWYKDEEKDPIYSYDARLAVFDSNRHHLKDLRLRDRITFTPSPGHPVPHKLTLNRLSNSDRGIYRCRVDFMRAQSSTLGAELRVVSPVESLIITDADGRPVPPVLTPIPEGGTLNLTCTARGGRPVPKVSWWFRDSIIDDSYHTDKSGAIANTLVLSPLNRAHAHSILVCKAATAPVATTTASVTIDMYLRPMSVELTGVAVTGSIRAGDYLDLTCTAKGSRPQPVITWYMGTTPIHEENTHKKSVSGVGGVSQVRVKVTRRDNGSRVTCRVVNPNLPHHKLQEHVVINVTYAPEVELRLGAGLKESVVKEDSNLYLTCHVDANPIPLTVLFMHKEQKLSEDKEGSRISINGNNLVLNRIQRNQAGQYSCAATNSQGKARSSPMNVTVLYSPVCDFAQDVWAEPGTTLTTQCRVHSSPAEPLFFSWVWVTNSYSRRVIPSQVTSVGPSSTVNFTVPRDNVTESTSSGQIGVLQCWAENTVGRQVKPCSISVRKPSPPSPPVNCSISGHGREVVTVTCQSGGPPLMPQMYRLQVYEVSSRKLIRNVTNTRPRFIVRGLTSGHDYEVFVSSHTAFGRSAYQLVEAFTFKAAENRMLGTEDFMPSLSTIVMFVGGVVALVTIIVIFVITVRIKMRKQSHKCVRRTATATDSNIPKKPSVEGISSAATTSQSIPIAQESSSSSSVKKDSLHPKDAQQIQESRTRELTAPQVTHSPHSPHSSHSTHSSTHSPRSKEENVPLQPIIRQPSKSLQPIIKENGRSERSEKSSQGRTVLFVEPPKAQSGILVNKSEVPRNAYDVYPGRRRHGHRGSYSEMRSSKWGDVDSLGRHHEMELPPRRYRSLDDGEESRGMNRQYTGSSVVRDEEYYQPYTSSMITSPPYSAREFSNRELAREYIRDHRRELIRDHPRLIRESSRDHPRDIPRESSRDHPRDIPRQSSRDHPRDIPRESSRDHPRDIPRESSRDHPRDIPRESSRDHPKDILRDIGRERDRDHVFVFPSRSLSGDYDHPQPTSIMKRSPSMSASFGRHYERPLRRSFEGGAYRSLPRPGKTRGEAEDDVLRKYRSLDRRFDLPFSGSVPRPEHDSGPDPCAEQTLQHQPTQHQRRYSGSPRARFGDEKHFHVYHDKEKKQNGVNDRDESFI